jgi:hypothetical protein
MSVEDRGEYVRKVRCAVEGGTREPCVRYGPVEVWLRYLVLKNVVVLIQVDTYRCMLYTYSLL